MDVIIQKKIQDPYYSPVGIFFYHSFNLLVINTFYSSHNSTKLNFYTPFKHSIIWECSLELKDIRLRSEEFIDFSPSHKILVVRNQNQKVISFYGSVLPMDGVCEFNFLFTLEFQFNISKVYFVTENVVYFISKEVQSILIFILSQRQGTISMFKKEEIKCGDAFKLPSFDQTLRLYDNKIVFFREKKTMILIDTSFPLDPSVQAFIPIFYEDLEFAQNFRLTSPTLAFALLEGFYIVLKHKITGNAYIAGYLMGNGIHNSLLFCQPLFKEDNKALKASEFQESPFVTHSINIDRSLPVLYLIISCRNYVITLYSWYQPSMLVDYMNGTFYEPATKSFSFFPIYDQISQQEREVISLENLETNDSGEVQFSLETILNQYSVRPYNKANQFDITIRDDTFINLNQLFQGFNVSYSVKCDDQLCESVEGKEPLIHMEQPYSVENRIQVQFAQSSSKLINSFNYLDQFVYFVDSLRTVTRISTEYFIEHKEDFDKMLPVQVITLRDSYDSIDFIQIFNDQISDQGVEFWVIAGKARNSLIRTIDIFSTYCCGYTEPDLSPVYSFSSSQNIIQVEYSQLYQKLAFVIHKEKDFSEIVIYSIYLSQSGSSYTVEFDKVIRPFNSQVNPFKVKEIAFHEELPILVAAVQIFGVVAYNLANYEIVFGIDLRHFSDSLTLFPEYTEFGPFEITGVKLNTNTLLSVIIKEAGVVWFEYSYYSDSIGSLVDDSYVIVRADSLENIVSGQLVAPTTQNININWIQFKEPVISYNYYKVGILQSYSTSDAFRIFQINSQIYADPYLNVYNYFQEGSRSQLQIPLTNYYNCTKVFQCTSQNLLAKSHFYFYVLCHKDLLFFNVSQDKALHVKTEQIRSFHELVDSQVKVLLQGQNANTKEELVLRLNIQSTKSSTFPLVGTIIVSIIICALLFISAKCFRNYKDKKKQEEEDDVVLLYRNSRGKINQLELNSFDQISSTDASRRKLTQDLRISASADFTNFSCKAPLQAKRQSRSFKFLRKEPERAYRLHRLNTMFKTKKSFGPFEDLIQEQAEEQEGTHHGSRQKSSKERKPVESIVMKVVQHDESF